MRLPEQLRRIAASGVAIGITVALLVYAGWALRGRPRPAHEGSGETMTSPQLLYREEPRYSDEALNARINAAVTVGGTVSTSGAAEDVKVLRSAGFGLDEAALVAFRKWRFAPAQKQGKPVNMGFRTVLRFRLPEQGIPTARIEFDLPSGARRPVLARGNLAGVALPNMTVDAEFDIDSEGGVKEIRCPDNSVAGRLGQLRFSPALLDGLPIKAHATLTMFRAD